MSEVWTGCPNLGHTTLGPEKLKSLTFVDIYMAQQFIINHTLESDITFQVTIL